MSYKAKFVNGVNAEHPLGKGEVVSSILTGSTTEALEIAASSNPSESLSRRFAQNSARTRVSIRGKSVDSVRQTFLEFTDWCTRRCSGDGPVTQAASRVWFALKELPANPSAPILAVLVSYVRDLEDELAKALMRDES